MSSPNLHPMLNVAVKAARAAGAIINRAALDVESVRISQKQVNDFVTEIDHASERAVIDTLLTANRDTFDLQLIREEWSPFAASEGERTALLEASIARRVVRRE